MGSPFAGAHQAGRVRFNAAIRCAQMWQAAALDALAAWLAEDAGRIEPRLAGREACGRFVALFAPHAAEGGAGEALPRLLDPFLRMLRRSPRIAVRFFASLPPPPAACPAPDPFLRMLRRSPRIAVRLAHHLCSTRSPSPGSSRAMERSMLLRLCECDASRVHAATRLSAGCTAVQG